jgi:hypothetical protein
LHVTVTRLVSYLVEQVMACLLVVLVVTKKQIRRIQLYNCQKRDKNLCTATIGVASIANDALANATHPCVLRGEINGRWNLIAGMLHSEENESNSEIAACLHKRLSASRTSAFKINF